jgi:uncharacterized protein (DUF305 family)
MMRNSISVVLAEIRRAARSGRSALTLGIVLGFTAISFGQSPSIVQPGAPGEATRKLPADTYAKLPAVSPKDVEFMQGMIHHHAQAVEMTALIAARTQNRDIQLLGTRISKSQEDEIDFMKRWLEMRGQPTEMKMTGHGHDAHGSHGGHQMLMPGMLTPAQMEALGNASGAEFDRLFLSGMIQHHQGALVMVEELFSMSGSGQDAELFNFASDVDSGQRAEIATMETLLKKIP